MMKEVGNRLSKLHFLRGFHAFIKTLCLALFWL